MELYIYIICLGVGFVFVMASAVFGHLLGGGHEGAFDGGHADAGHVGAGGHAEAGLEGDNMPGVSPFSPTIIASFVASFGGLGIIFHQIPATSDAWLSAPLALLGAFLIAGSLIWMLRKLFNATQSSSESRVVDVIGLIAEVITPIPAAGVGEIAYIQKGARYSAPAREQTGSPIANGAAVKIVRVAGSQFYVSAV